MELNFNPDQAPDEDFIEVGRQGRLAAHYLRTLKDQGLCEHEAIELTREWMALCVQAAKDDDAD